MAGKVKFDSEELRQAAERLMTVRAQILDAVKTHRADCERLGRPWGTGAIGDMFGPQYVKNRDSLLDAGDKIAQRCSDLSRVGVVALGLEWAEWLSSHLGHRS